MTYLEARHPSTATYSAWVCSLLFHGLAVASAFLLLGGLKPVLSSSNFRWEVALLDPPPPSPTTEVKPTERVERPSKPTAAPPQPMKRVEQVTPSPQEIRTVESKPVIQQTAHSHAVQTAVVERAQAVERQSVEAVSRQAASSVQTQQATETTRSVTTQETAERTSRVVTKAEEGLAQRQAVTREAATVTHEQTGNAVQTASAVSTQVAPVHRESAASAVQTAPAPVQTIAQTQTGLRTESRVEPQVESIERPVLTASPAPAAVEHQVAKVESAVIQEARVRHEMPSAPSREPKPAESTPTRIAPAAKADYAWLAEALGRRVLELKRYPAAARRNGWEGRVVLRAVIRSDGNLADVKVQTSSGYDALDKAAMDVLRLACPLHMRHELGRPEVVVSVPIVYSLKN